jgi:tetratricopeptide (TPR) repeat protein
VELDPRKEKESTKEAAFLLEVQLSIPAGTVPSLRAFVEKYPDCGRAMEVHRALARALEDRKDHEGEIPSCEVLHLRAPDAETRNGLAWVLAKAGKDAARALALVDEALKEKPESAAFMDTRAECLSRLGRHDEAVALQKKAMEVLGGSAPKDVRTLYEEHLKELEKRRDEARK